MSMQKVAGTLFLGVAINSLGCSAEEIDGVLAQDQQPFVAIQEDSTKPELQRLDAGPASIFGRRHRDAGPPPEADAGPIADAGTAMDAGSPETAPASSVYGWNLDFIYSGAFGFADKMKMARDWISCAGSTWDDGRAIATDSEGWPTSLLSGQEATTLINTDDGGHFVVTWTGAGTLDVRDHLGVVSQAPNRIVVDTAADSLLQLRITAVPVRDVEIRKEGQATDLTWDPVFVQGLSGSGVVRFMQWGMTNGDNGGVPATWNERSSPTYFTQNQTYGVAYEHMIALSNHLQSDAWITIPHLADDAHIQNLANLVRDSLDPNLKIYVEWSNEVWNDSFPQAAYARQQGTAAGLGNGDSHVARLQYQARRSREVFSIFETSFAGQMQRVVRVVASQCGNSWNDNQMMGFEDLASHTDALAIAPYFGHNAGREANAQSVRNGGTTWVLDHLEQVALPQLIGEIQMSAASAVQWGVPLIAYEGGQHVVAEPSLQNDDSVTSVLEDAQRDGRMYDLYGTLLAAWDAAGGGLFVHYTYTGAWNKWGYWGALERNDSAVNGSGAHKYRAISDWAAGHP